MHKGAMWLGNQIIRSDQWLRSPVNEGVLLCGHEAKGLWTGLMHYNRTLESLSTRY